MSKAGAEADKATLRVPAQDMRALGMDILTAYGTSDNNAQIVVDHLIDASLRGLEAHGVMRFAEYAAQLEKGAIDGRATVNIRRSSPSAFKVDGQGGFGQVAMMTGVDLLRVAVAEQPMAAAAVVNVGHTGRIGAYAEMLAASGCLGAVFGGGGHLKFPSVAPFGGRRGVMSTNPVAFAMPGRDDIPLSVDFATAASAGGKLRYARDNRLALPEGQIVDRNGDPSTVPADYFDGGAILPLAGPKGTGMAAVAELLGYAMLGEAQEFNWFIQATRLSFFGNEQEYEDRARIFLDKIDACPPARGFERVYYPGELEKAKLDQGLSNGITVSGAVVKAIRDTCAKRSLTVPASMRA